MTFTKKLRARIQRGEITCSIRVWQQPRVKVGGRYKLGSGHVEVESIERISFDDVTPGIAKRSGFNGVVDLMKTAKHGRGEKVYLVEFRYVEG